MFTERFFWGAKNGSSMAKTFFWECTSLPFSFFAALAGGYLAHSLAIMTDAAHLLTDFGSMMVSIFSLWISSRPPTKRMNFGWHRSGESISSQS